jgi:CDP-glycerol glycerophosphotransferase
MSATPAPALTVVIPVHNVERYLIACLDSVLSDPGADIEVVAVDDRSPDGSGALLDDYAGRDPRLRVVHMSRNVGLGGARNVGLAHARGAYIWFVDGDDWLPAGALPAVLERLAATTPDVLVVDHVEVLPGGRTRTVARAAPPEAPGPLATCPDVLRLAQSACTKVVRRGFLDEIRLRFPPGWYEDCAYTYPLLLAAPRIDVLDRVCYCYRQQPASGAITKTRSARHFEVFDQYGRLFALLDKQAPEYEPFRADLFRLMIDHYLVIVGNERRLPGRLRRPFFHRIAQEYRRWVPITGYPMPGGAAGLKHQLVERDNYLAYAVLRWAYRFVGAARRRPTTAGAVAGPAAPRQRRRGLSVAAPRR